MDASLTMIDRHYGHLARDGREHAIGLLDEPSRATAAVDAGGRCVDVDARAHLQRRQRQHGLTRRKLEAL